MRQFALIGEKLGHSLSAPIHQAIWRALGVDAVYRLIEIPREEVPATLPRLLGELDGFNVTIPYKQTVIPFLNSISPLAAEAGAVNTVRCADALGDNTDITGFQAMLRLADIDPRGQPCYILGTGGAAKGAAVALRAMGAAEVTLVSRHPQEGQLSYTELAEHFSGLLVNATPAGMLHVPDTCPLTDVQLQAILPRAIAVADVVYNPRKTPLLCAAEAAGLPISDGLVMLAAQAIAAEAIWLGQAIPDDLIPSAMKEAEAALP